jgi:hypothetical protein
MNKHRDYDFKNGGFVNETEKRQYLSDTNQEGLKMKRYRVCVEEVYRGWEWVEANSPEEAEELVREMMCNGSLNPVESYDGDTYIDTVDEKEVTA